MNLRDAKLRGIRAASEVHHQLGIDRYIKEGMELVDVFSSIADLDIPALCRPLEGLLGAYHASENSRGILITTNRRLPIQRFTAAHELGHAWLGHESSLDSEDLILSARTSPMSVAVQEIEAESFASEFLLPKTLFYFTAKRQGWNKASLCKPETVYQLSLRTCTSYEATWRAMLEHKLIDRKAADILSSATPKEAKASVLGQLQPSDPWADALNLRAEDSGTHILASPQDTVVLSLSENASSGYRWEGLENQPNVELLDDRNSSSDQDIGSVTQREMAFRGTGNQTIHLEQKRPWESGESPLNEFDIEIDFNGQERGLPRAARQ